MLDDGISFLNLRFENDVNMYGIQTEELNRKVRTGIIGPGERTKLREVLIVENLLKDYTKGGNLIEQDGRK